MTINIHHEQKETVYYIDINGVDHIMTRSYGLDNDGKPMQGIWGVYNELTGELIDCHRERRVLRNRLTMKDAAEQAGCELVDVKLQTVKPGDLDGIPEPMTVETFIPEDGREEQTKLIEKHGHLKVKEIFDGTKYTFPSTTHTNVYRWALLEDGSVIGFNESPRSGWSFPRIATRGQITFYKSHKCQIPFSVYSRISELMGK